MDRQTDQKTTVGWTDRRTVGERTHCMPHAIAKTELSLTITHYCGLCKDGYKERWLWRVILPPLEGDITAPGFS